jgi:hypothetical protein
MKPHTTHSAARRASLRGFTLVEMLVAIGSASLLLAAVVSLGIFTSRSFYMMGNYVDLDSQSRNAVDILGRQIRDASQLLAFGTGGSINSSEYLELTNRTAASIAFITYSAGKGTLMLTNIQGGTTTVQMLLTNCDLWSFSLFDRYPDTNALTFYSATNSLGQLDPTKCKVINLSWKCSRKLLGSKFNTESVQTAQIALRNKVK